MKYTPFLKLESDRLFLRQLLDSDDLRIFQLRSDDRINKYIKRHKPVDVNQAREFIDRIKSVSKEGNSLYWVICLRDDPTLIGTICLWNFSQENMIAEVGYEMLPDHQGQGYADEALKTVIRYGFKMIALQSIEAHTHKDNARSSKLLERNHFVQIANETSESSSDEIIYRIHQSQYDRTD
jgi:[ribosomal protein S5]-alanine N-acetyltransferase